MDGVNDMEERGSCVLAGDSLNPDAMQLNIVGRSGPSVQQKVFSFSKKNGT